MLYELLFAALSAASAEYTSRLRYGFENHCVHSCAIAACSAAAVALLSPFSQPALNLGLAFTLSSLACSVPDLLHRRPCSFALFTAALSAKVLPLFLIPAGISFEYPLLALFLLACASCLLAKQAVSSQLRENLARLQASRPGLCALLSALPFSVFPPALGLLLIGDGGIGFCLTAVICLSGILVLSVALQQVLLERLQLRETCSMMEKWQMETRNYMNVVRAQRHDFNLHMHAVSGMISSEAYEDCKDYVNKLVKDAAEINEIMPVYDMVIGSMLYDFREEARKIGSDIHYLITYDMQDVVCNAFECNKIIGNLIQNALDALITEEARAEGVRVSIFKRRGNTVISVVNRFSGDPDVLLHVFEPGFSTKSLHEGIGLITVEKLLKKYGGSVYVETEDQRVRFTAAIPNRVRYTEAGEEMK